MNKRLPFYKICLSIAVAIFGIQVSLAQVNEDFDGFTDTGYGNYSYNNFDINDGLSEVTNARSGRSIRLRNATDSNLEYVGSDGNGKDGGVGTISFWYRSWDSSPTAVYDVEISVNGGAYSAVGNQISTTSVSYIEWSYDLDNPSDNIKVRVIRASGERLIIDDFSITDFTANGNDLTSTINTPSSQVAASTVNANNVNTQANAVDVFSFEIEDAGSGDNLPTNVTEMRFTPGTSNTLIWGDDLQGVRLYNETNGTYENPDNVTILSTEIILEFSTPVIILDNTSEEFTLSFYINSTDIADNDNIQVEISNTNHGFESNNLGSAFEEPLISSAITGNITTVNVEATQLSYLQQPTDTSVNEVMDPSVQIAFTDENGNVDSTYTSSTGTVSIITTGSLDGSATTSVNATDGIAVFDNLIFDTEQVGVTLTATHANNFITGTFTSNSFDITALPQTIAIQDFEGTTPEWTYSSDVAFFDNGSDGFYGLTDVSSASGVDYSGLTSNILYENDLEDGAGNIFANTTFATVSLNGYTNVTLTFDYDIEGYNAADDDAKYQLFYDGSGQGEVYLVDGGIDPQDAEGTVSVSIPDSVDDVYLVVSIRDNGNSGYSAFDNFQLEGAPDTPQSYVFDGTSWFPENPQGGISGSDDDINIQSGTVIFTQEVIANNFTVDNGATVEIRSLLEVNGDLTNNGSLTFASTSETQTGILGELPSTSTVTGDVTVERYLPAKRAYRFLTSAVNSSSINANWQEGDNNTGTSFPADNKNPNSGYGTHITGSTTGADGFDATPSGNPSLFTFDNITQTWEDVTNTNTTTLDAGSPYRIFVRGDRSVDVTDNDATATATILRATGTLETGTVTYTDMSDFSDDFNFIGNPYQAPVDMIAVLNNSTNIKTTGYYTWESDLSTQGAYVYIEDDGTVTPSGSNANTYLQPGQAAFVVTENTSSGTSVIFEEAYKASTSELTQVFRSGNNSMQIVGNLYSEVNYTNNDAAVDGFRIKFADNFSNVVDSNDGTKPFNIDENMGVMNGSHMLIVEERELPANSEQIQLFNNNYRNENYVLSLEVPNFGELTAYLQDNYTGEFTELNEGENTITFSVNKNNESFNTDRFSIVFSTDALKVNNLENNSLVIYPNPLNDGALHIEFGNLKGYDKVTISAYNVLGKRVYHTEKQNVTSSLEINEANNWQSGVYIIRINDGVSTITKKIIKQ